MSVAHHPNEVGGRSQGDQPNPGQEPPTGDGAHQATTQGPAAFSGDLSRFASVSGGSPSSTQIPDALPSTTAGGAERADTRPTDNSAFGRVALPPTPPVAATAQAHKRNRWVKPTAITAAAAAVLGVGAYAFFGHGGDSDATAKNPTGGDQPAATGQQFPSQASQEAITNETQSVVIPSTKDNPSVQSQKTQTSSPEAPPAARTNSITPEEINQMNTINLAIGQTQIDTLESQEGWTDQDIQKAEAYLTILAKYPKLLAYMVSNDPRDNAHGFCEARNLSYSEDNIGIMAANLINPNSALASGPEYDSFTSLINSQSLPSNDPNHTGAYACNLDVMAKDPDHITTLTSNQGYPFNKVAESPNQVFKAGAETYVGSTLVESVKDALDHRTIFRKIGVVTQFRQISVTINGTNAVLNYPVQIYGIDWQKAN